MSKHKSEDLKLLAVKYYLKIKNQRKTCKIFGCSERSLMRWVKKFNDTNEIKRIKRTYIAYKIKKEYITFIKNTIKENKTITINDFQVNCQLEIVMKLTHVWANQTKIGLSSQIYQIKYYAPPEQLEINFIDTDIVPPPKKIVYEPVISNYTPLIKPPIPTTQTNIVIRPSLLDISNALKSLKKKSI